MRFRQLKRWSKIWSSNDQATRYWRFLRLHCFYSFWSEHTLSSEQSSTVRCIPAVGLNSGRTAVPKMWRSCKDIKLSALLWYQDSSHPSISLQLPHIYFQLDCQSSRFEDLNLLSLLTLSNSNNLGGVWVRVCVGGTRPVRDWLMFCASPPFNNGPGNAEKTECVFFL